MQFHICNCYLSITENLLPASINLVKNYCTINNQEVNIIKQDQKLILFHDASMRTKSINPTFSVAMGSFDSTEACELVGLLLLWRLRCTFDSNSTGLDKGEVIILLPNTNPQQTERLRKN